MRAESERMSARKTVDLPWRPIPSQPPQRPCYVRFSTLVRDHGSRRRAGFLTHSYEVLDNPDLDPIAARGVREALDWFEQNLRVPHLKEKRAIFFFKSSAATCMARAWELIHWLREAGVVVEMQTAIGIPGHILFEDEHQVAAVPGRESRVR